MHMADAFLSPAVGGGMRALDSLGIAHLAPRAPHTLSGGEKKSSALASILSMEPKLLLLDEPPDRLAPCSRKALIRNLQSLPHSMRVVSHNLDFIWECCPTLSIIHNEKIVETGESNRILTNR